MRRQGLIGHLRLLTAPFLAWVIHAYAWVTGSAVCKQSVFMGNCDQVRTTGQFAFAASVFWVLLYLISSPAYALNNFPGTTISGASGSLTASNFGATSEAGEPTTYGGGAVNSMWYSWTAPSDGNLVVQTCGGSTSFDTTLQTFTGSTVGGLTQLATNDDACGLQSSNSLSVTSGTTYRVQVDGYANATGTFTLSWTFTAVTPPAPVGTQVCSALTGAWSGGSATSGGIGVTRTLSASGGGSWSGATTDTMNTIAAWSSASVQGNPSQVDTFNWTGPTSTSGDTGTYTISFSKPVTNPVIHIDRVGGVAATGQSNSSEWELTSGGTLFRLAGVGHFETLSDNTFFRTVGVTSAGTQSSTNTSTGTAAGSVMISGTHSSVTFRVSGLEPAGAAGGDAFEVVACAPQADLSLAKSVNNPTPTVGGNVIYTVTLTNSGADAAPGVVVTDVLPAGLTFVSATPSQGSASNSSGTVTWNAGTVAVGGTPPTLQIEATVTAAGTISNTAEVTASTYVDPDSNPNDGTGDDVASIPITAAPGLPTVTLTKISNGGTGGFTFTGNNGWSSQIITTTAAGGSGTTGATQTLSAASTATTITETIPSGWAMTGVTCTGTGDGTQPTVNTTAGTITFSASQTTGGSNIACTVTNLRIISSLNIVKSFSLNKLAGNTGTGAEAGDTIVYTYVVTNDGNQTISNVEVDDSGHTGQGTWVDPAHNGTITADNGPTGDSPDSNGDATIWGTLGPLDVITFTSNYVVTQADIDGQM